MSLTLIIKQKIKLDKSLIISILIVLISLLNFSSLRYSAPIFYAVYIMISICYVYNCKDNSVNFKLIETFLYLYILLSIPFIFLSTGWNDQGRFSSFIGSPTVFSGLISIVFLVVSNRLKLKSLKFILIYITVLVLVYMSKTRLLLLFMMCYPILSYVIKNNIVSLKKVFLGFLIMAISVYPLYSYVTEKLPFLVTMRYKKGQYDKSKGLRIYLNNTMLDSYSEGSIFEVVFGKGNEFSRRMVYEMFNKDVMPHNDFWRIIIDWGLIGLFLLILLIYKLSIKNLNVLMISIVYFLLFYSNMVFNIFLISFLIMFSFNKPLIKKIDVKNS